MRNYNLLDPSKNNLPLFSNMSTRFLYQARSLAARVDNMDSDHHKILLLVRIDEYSESRCHLQLLAS
jgi:hypothetical protein